jgi:sugar O-acyltransferase (sialic acid O-acetyltransferase NeuD family)
VRNIIVVGAGGFGRDIFEYVSDVGKTSPDIKAKGLLDDDPKVQLLQDRYPNVPILGDTRTYQIEQGDEFLISVGDPVGRKTLAERLADRGARFYTLVHPTAYVSPSARIGAGCIVGPFACVGSYSKLEKNILLCVYAVVGHDCGVGSHSTFSPFSVATGGSSIGSEVFFGSHAVVTPLKRVGSGSKVAAGAVVYHDIPEECLVTGNPATFRRQVLVSKRRSGGESAR